MHQDMASHHSMSSTGRQIRIEYWEWETAPLGNDEKLVAKYEICDVPKDQSDFKLVRWRPKLDRLVTCCIPSDKTVRFSSEQLLVDLSLTTPLTRDVATYLGLLGREARSPKAKGDFYSSEVTLEEITRGVTLLCVNWESCKGLFVDSRRVKSNPKLLLPWKIALFSPTPKQERVKDPFDVGFAKQRAAGIQAGHLLPPSSQDSVSSGEGGVDRSTVYFIPEDAIFGRFLLTNIRSLAPASWSDTLAKANTRRYNILIGKLYEPNNHLAKVVASNPFLADDKIVDKHAANLAKAFGRKKHRH